MAPTWANFVNAFVFGLPDSLSCSCFEGFWVGPANEKECAISDIVQGEESQRHQ